MIWRFMTAILKADQDLMEKKCKKQVTDLKALQNSCEKEWKQRRKGKTYTYLNAELKN